MCLDLPPLGECAWGQCVSGECVCDPGVIQSTELLFHPIPGNSTIICDHNVKLTVVATIILLVFSAGMFLLQLAALTKLRQVSLVSRLWCKCSSQGFVGEKRVASADRIYSSYSCPCYTPCSTNRAALGNKLPIHDLPRVTHDGSWLSSNRLFKYVTPILL